MQAKPHGRAGPDHYLWKGGTHITDDGYRLIYSPDHPRRDAHNRVREHILIAENALGRPLPQHAEVHHVDGNKANNERFNLVICQDRKYHMLIHARMRIVAAGGNPNKQKVCGHCKKLKARTEFHANKYNSDGLHFRCKICRILRSLQE